MELHTYDQLRLIARRNDRFVGLDDHGVIHTVKWQRQPYHGSHITNPAANFRGVSGYCELDGTEGRRVHVCGHDPCSARWGAGKYGNTAPPDYHLRVASMSAHAAPIIMPPTVHVTATHATSIPAPSGHVPSSLLPSCPASSTPTIAALTPIRGLSASFVPMPAYAVVSTNDDICGGGAV